MSYFGKPSFGLSRGFLLGVLGGIFAISCAQAAEDYQVLRERLVAEISQDVSRTSNYIGKSKLDERVMRVIGTVGSATATAPALARGVVCAVLLAGCVHG